MLRKTFCHVPGIGRQAEQDLWAQGCHDWSIYLQAPELYSIGYASQEIAVKTIAYSEQALEKGDHQFFGKALGLQESWRAWASFRKSCVYLDIETNGGRFGDSVTVIGLYDGSNFQALIKNDNLGNFLDIISHYSMIVTFFGSQFDLPMLQRCFKGLKFDQIHLDLCLLFKKLGYRGGLKSIEKQFGLERGKELKDLRGMDAIRLWETYQKNDDRLALKKLVDYNRLDVVNLEKLAEIGCQKMQELVAPKLALMEH